MYLPFLKKAVLSIGTEDLLCFSVGENSAFGGIYISGRMICIVPSFLIDYGFSVICEKKHS